MSGHVFLLVLATASGIAGALIIVGNLIIAVRYLRGGRRGSTVPLLGSIMSALGLLAIPKLHVAAVIPFAFDPGGLTLVIGLVVRRIRKGPAEPS